MFQDKLKPEATPERVFELCRIVGTLDKSTDNSGMKTEVVREIIEPATNSASTSYFPSIKKAAVELGLLDEDNTVKYIGDKNHIKDLEHFRKYCNSVLFKDKTWEFYKLCKAFIMLNDKWLSIGSITSDDSAVLLSKYSSYPVNDLKKTLIPACRFWLSFLGYGYIQEKTKINFLPNAYIALKDFITLSSLEKGREYSIREFFELMPESFSILTDDDSLKLNLALSNALRQLNDCKEIELRRNLDSETVWSLFPFSNDNSSETVTHIIYKGVK